MIGLLLFVSDWHMVIIGCVEVARWFAIGEPNTPLVA
jgi:hypothetical protein